MRVYSRNLAQKRLTLHALRLVVRSSTSSTVAWEKLRRMTVIPAWTSSCRTGSCSEVGPIVATILVRDPWQLLGGMASPSSSLSSPTEDWRVGMVLAEMAEKAVAEMGRLWQEAAAKKLLPPIDAERRLAMEMAPRIIFGGGWWRRKDMQAMRCCR